MTYLLVLSRADADTRMHRRQAVGRWLLHLFMYEVMPTRHEVVSRVGRDVVTAVEAFCALEKLGRGGCRCQSITESGRLLSVNASVLVGGERLTLCGSCSCLVPAKRATNKKRNGTAVNPKRVVLSPMLRRTRWFRCTSSFRRSGTSEPWCFLGWGCVVVV